MFLIARDCEHSYIPSYLEQAPLVLDLGANHGEFSRIMASRFGARCVAVEPNRRLHQDIRESGVVDLIPVAIGTSDGEASFNVSTKDDTSSFHIPAALGSTPDTVQTRRLESLLDSLNLRKIDLLKIDIEGLEVEALNGLRAEQLSQIQQCTVEFHDQPGYVSQREIESVTSRMRQAGFRYIRMSVRDYSDVLYIRADLCSFFEWSRIRFIEVPLHRAKRLIRRVFPLCSYDRHPERSFH